MNDTRKYEGPTKAITLPGGVLYEGELHRDLVIKEMGGDEERMLGSKNPNMELIVSRCIKQIGPHTDQGLFHRDIIPNMRMGDYNKVVFELRRLSLGDSYDYKTHCPNCNHQNKFTVDLKDIEEILAKDPERQEYEWKMRSGASTTFRALRVRDAEQLAIIQKEEEDVLRRSLALRLVSVDGVRPEGSTPKARIKNGIKLLMKNGYTLGEGERIRMWFKEEERTTDEDGEELRYRMDPLMDTLVIDTCEKCGADWRHHIPVDPTFLLPSMEE